MLCLNRFFLTVYRFNIVDCIGSTEVLAVPKTLLHNVFFLHCMWLFFLMRNRFKKKKI